MQIRQVVCLMLVNLFIVALAAGAEERFVTIERFIPHTSTVPVTAGQRVGLYLREKATVVDAARFPGRLHPIDRGFGDLSYRFGTPTAGRTVCARRLGVFGS